MSGSRTLVPIEAPPKRETKKDQVYDVGRFVPRVCMFQCSQQARTQGFLATAWPHNRQEALGTWLCSQFIYSVPLKIHSTNVGSVGSAAKGTRRYRCLQYRKR